jgi:hypothetical protein
VAAGVIVLVLVGVSAAAILRPRPTAREIGFAMALGLLAVIGGLLEWLASGRTSVRVLPWRVIALASQSWKR